MTTRFFCDAMLKGLSRWLRAAGYDAAFEHGIDDAVLLRRGADEGRVVLSSDGGIFERNIVKDGTVRALYVPRATPPIDQLSFVLRTLGLPLTEPRCMACGGELLDVPKSDVSAEAPPRSFAAYDRFWKCASCTKLYWRGTHWDRIERRLGTLAQQITASS